MQLECMLKSHLITSEGDFIPAGTPCKVLQWSTTDNNLIVVKTTAYMHAGGVGENENINTSDGQVCRGLVVNVAPSKLQFRQAW
jgi:hypothetical protein